MKDIGTGPTRNRRTVWKVQEGDVWDLATQSYKGAHFATFPAKLVEPCVLAGSPPGGVILDPCAGSGTVGEVAHRLGRRFVGVELSPAYCQLAVTRTAQPRVISRTPMTLRTPMRWP